MKDTFAARTHRFILPNGITLLVLENPANPTVSVTGYLKAGSFFNPSEQHGLSRLTADMLSKGTRRRSKLEIAEALEFAGARVSFSGNTFTVSVAAQALSRDFGLVISTLAEELREPEFPAAELEKLKQRIVAGIQQGQEDTRSRAIERFAQLVYSPESPFTSRPPAQLISEVERVIAGDLRQFYEQHYGAASLILTVVGDVKAEEVRGLIGETLAIGTARLRRTSISHDTTASGTRNATWCLSKTKPTRMS